jgi:hypothetical protein
MPVTPAEILIMAAGAVMLVGSFFDFASSTSAWGSYWFPIVTLIPVYGVAMAGQIALDRFANVEMPDRVFDFTWEQLHLLLGVFAAVMAVAWLFAADHKELGFWVLLTGSVAAAVGAFMLQAERRPATSR